MSCFLNSWIATFILTTIKTAFVGISFPIIFGLSTVNLTIMSNTISKLLLLFFIAILTSCASGYKAIHPDSLNYPSISEDGNFSFKYNVLKDKRNKKFAKKEDKFRVRIVAVKIKNTTGKTLKYGENYVITSGTTEVRILEPDVASYQIRQKVPTYLLYLLLSGSTINTSGDPYNTSDEIPIGYVLGPGLAGLNMAVAAGANKHLRQDLTEHSIIGRDIKNGETFYGLVGIQDNGFAPLSLKLMR
jgi:hypothetical protein